MKFKTILLCCIIFAAGSSVVFAQNKTSMDYLGEASRQYMDGEYKKAIPLYEKALELEKKERKLKKDLWLVMVDNLAISYGITGDIEKSQSVLKYGIEQEPTYPMFYYNMAWATARRTTKTTPSKTFGLPINTNKT